MIIFVNLFITNEGNKKVGFSAANANSIFALAIYNECLLITVEHKLRFDKK